MVRPEPTGGFEWVQVPWGHALRCRPLLEHADHLFTAADLRLREDAGEWRQLAALMQVGEDRLLVVNQVHRADVATARRSEPAWSRPEADVVVSDDPEAAVVIRVADCAPVLIADARLGVVAGVHAGWRGTVQRAAAAGVAALVKTFGSAPADLVAAIGPCLSAGCGEVGDEVVEAFRDAGHREEDVERWFTRRPGRRPHLDLPGANRDQLIAAGLRASNVHEAGLCTRTHADVFHSYRASGADAGRMAAVIRARQTPA